MAIRHTLIIAPLLLALTACETAQENPNYKYSSTYKETAPHLAQNSRHPDQVQSPAPVRYVNTTPVQQGTQTIQTSTIHTSSSAIVPTTYSNTSSTQQIYTRVDSNCATNGIHRLIKLSLYFSQLIKMSPSIMFSQVQMRKTMPRL